MKEKVIVSWSGGKDSALALYEIKKSKKHEVVALLTTVTGTYKRISMHGVRRMLLEQQARSLGIPLGKVIISKNTTHKQYEDKMRKALRRYRRAGVSSVVIGDIFLEDLRKYREKNLSRIGMKGIFPLWQKNTTKLSHTFIKRGFKAVVACIDSKVLDKKFAGRNYNKQFLCDLPRTVDPCGENGEFHSFVFAGPLFKRKIRFATGKTVLRDKRFYFSDLKPA